jgi:hypothetical protein
MLSALTGFFFGLIHVFSGPDHLTAIAPIAVKHPRRAWLTGAQWGLGHSAGVFFVGLLVLLFREILPLASISSWSERIVGLLLIGIGIWGLRKALSQKLHTHAHTHEGGSHVHFHLHSLRESEHQHNPHAHSHAAFGIGTLHGVAGSSHLLSVLPAFALKTQTEVVAYLFAFGLGTIAAMAAFSYGVGFWATHVGSLRAYRRLMAGSSALTLAVGVFWFVTAF